MFKSVISFLVIFAMSFGVTASSPSSSLTYAANVAYVNGVNDYGTNMVGDSDNTEKNVSDYVVYFNQNQTDIQLMMEINNENVIVNGTPVARTESGKTIFFEGICNNSRYEIANFAYVEDISVTNYYFKNTYQQKYSQEQSVLKIYLRDLNSSTLDFVIIEVFGIEINFTDAYLSALEVNPLLGSWTPKYFKPLSVTFEECESTETRAADDSNQYTCIQTFYDSGDNQTHTITWEASYDYPDITSNQTEDMKNGIKVVGKSITYSDNTDLNSNTMSYLMINGLILDQVSIPHTAWRSSVLHGKVRDVNYTGLSASFSLSLGLLSLSYDISSFTNDASGSYIGNSSYTSYMIPQENRYPRIIRTTMGSGLMLSQIGHWFEITSEMREFGGSPQSPQTLRAQWTINVYNNATREVCTHTNTQNGLVEIT